MYRAGCIQPGDRILRINQQSTAGMNLDEVVELMRDSKPRMTLDVEFDVADSVVPATGVYWLKLIKPTGSSSTFGITLQGKLNIYFKKKRNTPIHSNQFEIQMTPKSRERLMEV